MRKFFFFISFLFLYAFVASGQSSIRDLIEGEKGKTARFTRLAPDKQVVFTPSAAKALTGLDINSDLALIASEPDQTGEVHHRFYQTYKNIRIENSMYIMHSENGKLTGMTGEIILDFDREMAKKKITASLSPAQAVQSALQNVNAAVYAWQVPQMEKEIQERTANKKASYYPSASLVWYSPGDGIDPTNMHLAYKVDVYATQPLSRAYYFIDAEAGEVLGKEDELCYSDATGTANTAYSGTQTIHSDLFSGSYRLRDLTKGNGIITLHGSDGTDYTSATANWSLSGVDQYALDIHYGVSQTYNFYKTNYNRNSVNNAGFALTSYANVSSIVNNAYWDGATMNFGVRSGSGAGIAGIDITGHELTHGVTQYTSGLIYSNEPGAMNESMSDIMGKSVQFWSKPADVNWLISNDISWLIRNMSNPDQFSQPDTYHGTNWYTGPADNGGVHKNSGVGNYMFYLLVSGGSGTNDLGNNYSVTGIGLTAADAIIYRSETVYLTPISQYADWRTACIYAATDLYGANSNEVAQVENAWYAVGIGSSHYCSTAVTISASGPTTFCSGSSVTLSASAGTGYLWSTGATSRSITVSTSGAYSVTENPCTSSPVTVKVNSLPSVAAGNNSPICSGNTFSLNSAIPFSTESYSVSQITYAPLSGSGTAITLADDDISGALPIGFNFSFYGSSYTNFYICSNGYISFSPNPISYFISNYIPNKNFTGESNLIALAWSDLYPPAGGTIDYFTSGTAPNRKLVVRFNGISYFSSSTPDITSQVILFETSNNIEIHSTSVTTDAINYQTQTMGIENNGGTIASAVPGRDAAYWSITNDARRFIPLGYSGVSYLWSGPNGFSSTQQNPNINNVPAAGAGTYTVTVTNTNGCTMSASTTVTINICETLLNLKMFIEGYYISGGYMTPVAYNELVPTATGVEADTIYVELHNASDPFTLIERDTTLLMTDGTAIAHFSPSVNGHAYYIAVYHRNTLDTWSAEPVPFTSVTNYDFSTNACKAYACNQANVDYGIWAFYNGDINQDENIDLLDFPPMDTDIASGNYGYYSDDLNGDGNVDLLDFPYLDYNIANGFFANHP